MTRARIAMNWYYGGTETAPTDMYADIDDITIEY